MIFIPTTQLRPGMILARDLKTQIIGPSSPAMLTKGQRLTDIYISKITQLNITGVYIQSKLTGDIMVQEPIDEVLKARTLNDIKRIFVDFQTSNCVLKDNAINKLASIAQDLVQNILSQDAYTTNLIDLKSYDDYTYHHSLSVAIISISTGIALGLGKNMLNELALSALLHDIGKMVIPLQIINKPGALTDEEFTVIKQHPRSAVQHLSRKTIIATNVLIGIECHHEKFDGTGYPNRKKGKNISLYGRILSVADVYDALTSNRPYRKQWLPNDAIEYMMGCTDIHFDQEVLVAFLKSVAAYPVGTCVTLSNGTIGIVKENCSENILRPLVVLINKDGTLGVELNMLSDPQSRNITIVGMGYDDARFDSSLLAQDVQPKSGATA